MKKAGFFRRFVAAFIDGLLFCGLFIAFKEPGLQFLSILYETILLAKWNGFTIGKKIMGIKVVTVSGGELDLLKAFIRSISKILSGIALCLGYLWMLWDKNSQTWHDKIAETYVVEA
jgi:uncharacterized RDD family membrane protein YckC